MADAEPQAAAPPTPDGAHDLLTRLHQALETVIRGKSDQLETVLACVAAGGHVLLEDIPGTGKTTLARALAKVTGCDFKRIQFTPDLLPTDIVGTSVFHPQQGTFSFRCGPVFAQVLIADEINRASPRTQSALLEALSEGQVTVDGETRPLPQPFVCIATENPVEFHGTYPLPEAQLDRFAVQLTLGYPAPEEEQQILRMQARAHPLQSLQAVSGPQQVAALQLAVESVRLEASVQDYLLALVHASRQHTAVRLGVSMRGALLFARLVRARALMQGRDFVLPGDVKHLAPAVLAHRLVLDTRARYAGTDKRAVVEELLTRVPVPR